jgi:hypothetical protein
VSDLNHDHDQYAVGDDIDHPENPDPHAPQFVLALGVDEDGKPYGSVVVELADRNAETASLRDRITAELREMGETGATGPQLLLALGVSADKRSSLRRGGGLPGAAAPVRRRPGAGGVGSVH